MTPAFYYITQGDFGSAILWVLTDYIGYGIIWLCLGAAVFGTLYQKSKSLAISGFGFSMFLSLLNYLMKDWISVEVQSLITVLVALMLFGVVYRVIR